MAHPVTVTDTTFKEEVLDSEIPVLVDFWASWCTPCKMIAPIVEEFATQHDGQVKVAKVDVDANPITPGMFGIMSIPTLMIFRDKVLLFAQPGALPQNVLEDIVKKVRELDMEQVRAEIARQQQAAQTPEQPAEQTPQT